jgi:hypothetical protein
MIPFFVVDRPISLNILKTSFVNRADLTFGLMTHAFVSENFLRLFAGFPCDRQNTCWLKSNTLCESNKQTQLGCQLGTRMRNKIIKMCDYGIFEKGSIELSYSDLFRVYEKAKADFGIMQDIFGDSKATIESAKRALEEYHSINRPFKLVLVAQGKTIDEYLRCFEELKKLGGEHIAIGGLLRRKERSVRYIHVNSDNEMQKILETIRIEFNPNWLFVLGAYHAERHQLFNELGVYGSDYKGWIFQYRHKRQILDQFDLQLSNLEKGEQLDNSFREIQIKRKNLVAIEARVRLEYIKTKNTSTENRIKKAHLKRKLEVAQGRISKVNLALVDLRSKVGLTKIKQAKYELILENMKEVLVATDQSIRIKGVHNYLESKIYTQYQQDIQTSTEHFANNSQTISIHNHINSSHIPSQIALIIPCGKAKIWKIQPNIGKSIAKDAYTSSLFRLCRSFAELYFPNDWFILSAHYGLIRPTQRISNYDVSFSNKSDEIVGLNTLKHQCQNLLSNYISLVTLCGKSYNYHLNKALKGNQSLKTPLASLALFARMSWLKDATANVNNSHIEVLNSPEDI